MELSHCATRQSCNSIILNIQLHMSREYFPAEIKEKEDMTKDYQINTKING
jgi:hypothetical protein